MSLFKSKVPIGRHSMIEDVTGKPINSLLVFSSAIKYLHDEMLKALNLNFTAIDKGDINFVFTVPAIWDDNSKQFMRIAAREAGIDMGHLSLALEPEAASIYCRHAQLDRTYSSRMADISTFPPGTQYLVCDALGGTVDITVHEVMKDMKLKEIEKASGGAWGGSKVDEAFEEFIDTLAGCAVMRKLKMTSMEDYLRFMRDFELTKRETKCKLATSQQIVIWIPLKLSEIVQELTGSQLKDLIERSSYKSQVCIERDKLKCDANIISALFDDPVKSIVDHLTTLLSKYDTNQINNIVMVGGFSESPLLQEAVRNAFPGMLLTIPHDAGLAVLKGAVMFGHNKRQIVSRISRYTYGICCNMLYNKAIHPAEKVIQEGPLKGLVENCFSKLVDIGQSLPSEKAAGTGSYSPPDGSSSYHAIVYATREKQPIFVKDFGCFMIGRFNVNCKDKNGKISPTEVYIYFGGTEIEVKATLNTTGEERASMFDLPD
ncbi:hypothetical protein DPMN_044337 [Dreissena polymorpha]|uniref:Heat shock 70 kDa protein 12A n=1 Tax=Dreissena polymorpha TaxID=45954 RepID=A0A9D4D278_DREPO|nr:hypothetical protein DPMN_044337 [Dreissena polymorpha]